MSTGELIYLSGVITAFVAFTLVLSAVQRIEHRKRRTSLALRPISTAERPTRRAA